MRQADQLHRGFSNRPIISKGVKMKGGMNKGVRNASEGVGSFQM